MEFGTFAFVSFAVKFVALALQFVALEMKLDAFAMELGTFDLEFHWNLSCGYNDRKKLTTCYEMNDFRHGGCHLGQKKATEPSFASGLFSLSTLQE